MADNPPVDKELTLAYQRLHHLSMCYAGAFIEVATGKPQGLVPMARPGLKAVRDLVDLVLIQRAELNCLMKFVLDKALINPTLWDQQLKDELAYMEKVKAEIFGVEVTDYGLSIKRPNGRAPSED